MPGSHSQTLSLLPAEWLQSTSLSTLLACKTFLVLLYKVQQAIMQQLCQLTSHIKLDVGLYCAAA